MPERQDREDHKPVVLFIQSKTKAWKDLLIVVFLDFLVKKDIKQFVCWSAFGAFRGEVEEEGDLRLFAEENKLADFFCEGIGERHEEEEEKLWCLRSIYQMRIESKIRTISRVSILNEKNEDREL